MNLFNRIRQRLTAEHRQTLAPSTAVLNKKLPPLTDEQQQISLRVEQCYQLAETKLCRRFPRPSVYFTLRGKSAGTAHLHENKLRFNPVLLVENQQEFVNTVVPHEICHLLAHQLYGRVRPHGKEWQSLMINLFGLSPSTTHQLDVGSVMGKQFDYQCLCGPVKLSVRRHNKVVRGETQYQCRRCKTQLYQSQ